MKRRLHYVAIGFALVHFGVGLPARAAPSQQTLIVSPEDASWAENLAAREVRRYIYLRTGQLLPIVHRAAADKTADSIIVARKDRALVSGTGDAEFTSALSAVPAQGYWLKTLPLVGGKIPQSKARVLVLAGGNDAGTLYAAYRFAEMLGVRFYLHGDVVPDESAEWKLPVLDTREQPQFALRGIQPFHDFPEGPDWWNRDDYLAVIGQLPKLRMNFFGLHTYPEARPNAEPTVWIGLPEDVADGPKVKFSYPSSYMNTLRGNWGYAPKLTSEYILGSAALFERDDFGPEVMFGAMPSPDTPVTCEGVFERSAELLRDAFTFAHAVGVKTCVGTETPLVVPKVLKDRLEALGTNAANVAVVQELYEGIFRRATQAYPLDYYWFWTPEGWTWSGVKDEQIKVTMDDLQAAVAAHKKLQSPFALATCGWVLGPEQDRAMFDKVLPKDVAVSCINRQVGYTPVDAGFAEVHDRGKWAIPWMEDDPALSSPQLWVGRMRRDAADALRYGCDGLMGIHWRTRVLGPNVSALAQAAWDQRPWLKSYEQSLPPPQPPRVAGPVGGQVAAFPNNPIADTADTPLYQTVRYNLSAYHLPASNGACKVTLKFCEPHYDAAGKRVFDVKLQGRTVLTNLDVFARVGKNRALDFTFADIAVTNGWLDIGFVPRVEYPCVAALDVEGEGFKAKVNCGGPAYQDYAADDAAAAVPKDVFASTQDFYEDWAAHEFGTEAGLGAARIFQRVDCALPKPSTWINGPGGIQPDPRPWEQVRKEYAFVDEFASLRPKAKGAGNLARFDYWLHTFKYFRGIGELNCAWAEYNRVMESVKREKDPAAQKELARAQALPARRKLVELLGWVYDDLLATVSTTGELGTVANWNQHNLPDLLTKPGAELAKVLGEALPSDAQPSMQYHGPMRVIVPTLRTSLPANDALKLKVIILSAQAPQTAQLYYRRLGAKRFTTVPLRHDVRGVYRAEIPAQQDDFEYYVQAQPERGEPVCLPATAPKLNQTVIVLP